MRKFATIATLSIAAALGGLTLAGPAAAADPSPGMIRMSTSSFMESTNKSKTVHTLKYGDLVHARCMEQGQNLPGLGNYWIRIGLNGAMGFVHQSTLTFPAGLPRC